MFNRWKKLAEEVSFSNHREKIVNGIKIPQNNLLAVLMEFIMYWRIRLFFGLKMKIADIRFKLRNKL